MSGVGEAALALGLISSIITIIDTAKKIYEAANDANGLPKAFNDVAAKLPLVTLLLEEAEAYTQRTDVDPKVCSAFSSILVSCRKNANDLQEIFQKVVPKGGAPRWVRYQTAARRLGKGRQVEDLIADILDSLNLMSNVHSFPEAMQRELARSLEEVLEMKPTLVNYQPTQQLRVELKDLLYAWLLPESISAPNPASDHCFYSDKLFRNPDTSYETCSWVFDTLEYQQFADPDTTTVTWLKGPTGCGKSVLSSAVINRIQGHQPPLPTSPTVLYCYGHRDPESTNSLTLVRVLLVQTLQWDNPQVMEELRKFQASHSVLKESNRETEKNLWNLLKTVIRFHDKAIYIVVDGCGETFSSLVLLITMTSKTRSSLWVSSRFSQSFLSNTTIQTLFDKYSVKSMQIELSSEKTTQDLKEYVTYRVNSHPSLLSKPEKIRDKIITGVCDKANGMFLYASLVLDDLKDDKISSNSAIERTLERLPKTLFEVYEKSLRTARDSIKGAEVFSWIFCSRASLNWNELKSGLAISPSGYSEDEMIDDSCETFIRHSCGQLVECYGENLGVLVFYAALFNVTNLHNSKENLRFIHGTVPEFLSDAKGPGGDLGIQKSHSMVSSKLLAFLEYEDLPDFAPLQEDYNPNEHAKDTIKNYSCRPGRGLYRYATFNWYKHLKECDKFQDKELEDKVLNFLLPSDGLLAFCPLVRWLKTALLMSNDIHSGIDSVTLTTDLLESLQCWVQGRDWSNKDSEQKVQSWMRDFLNLMLDWGKALETSPFYIHYLHHELLPEMNYFQKLIGEDDQSVFQFHPNKIETRSTELPKWPNNAFAIDVDRNLAYSYDESSFILCHNMFSGLLVSEIPISFGTNVAGPIFARKGALCPEGKLLAVVFEAVGASDALWGKKIRSGYRLTMDVDDAAKAKGFSSSWTFETAPDFDANLDFTRNGFGFEETTFIVCLLQLNHSGIARTNILSLADWATSPVLEMGTLSMGWDLDDNTTLIFSIDSTKLATPFGIFDITNGKKAWSLDPSLKGAKMARDFQTLAAVRTIPITFDNISATDIDAFILEAKRMLITVTNSLELFNVHDLDTPRQIPLPGIVHLLAISNRGRFLLLLRVDHTEDQKAQRKEMVCQREGRIGIFDCHNDLWVTLMVNDAPSPGRKPKRQKPWEFEQYRFPAQFSNETEKKTDTNKIILYAPKGWKIASHIGRFKGTDQAAIKKEPHLIIFEGERFKDGFGKRPLFKQRILASVFKRKPQAPDDLGLVLMDWTEQLDAAIVYQAGSVVCKGFSAVENSHICVDQKQDLDSSVLGQIIGVEDITSLLTTPCRNLVYHIFISSSVTKDANREFLDDKRSRFDLNTHPHALTYTFKITGLNAAESWSKSQTVTHCSSIGLHYPAMSIQTLSTSDEQRLSMGSIELGLSYADGDLRVEIKDPRESILQKALRSFERRVGLFKTSANPALPDQDSSNSIPGRNNISFTTFETFEGVSSSFMVSGAQTIQSGKHIFQFWRPLDVQPTPDDHRQAKRFEVYLCLFDERTDDISWFLHTSTAGEKTDDCVHFPQATWTYHPHLPLLAWLLPGHRLRISNTESPDAPITVAESIKIEGGSTQAMKFSPDGHYLMVHGRNNMKNDFMQEEIPSTTRSIMLINLREGITTEIMLSSSTSVSFDIDNDYIHMYRLTRNGAVEEGLYTLSNLELSKRQYLTFIPSQCCCSTCGKPLESSELKCTISVFEDEYTKAVVIGHSPLNLGRAVAIGRACEPLILRVTMPIVHSGMEHAQNTSLISSSRVKFPKIVNEEGRLYDVSSPALQLPLRTSDIASCAAFPEFASGDFISDQVRQMETLYLNGKPLFEEISMGQLSEIITHVEVAVDKRCRLRKKYDIKFNYFKAIFGDEFPFDTWAEFKTAMDELEDDSSFNEYMRKLWDGAGMGCRISLSVRTVSFCNPVPARQEGDSRWSLALTIGWIEEDVEWFYERFFNEAMVGSRMPYEFRAYVGIIKRGQELEKDQTAKGTRFRKLFNKVGEEAQLSSSTHQPESGTRSHQTMEGYLNTVQPVELKSKLRDLCDAMSDFVPGMGKVMQQRMVKAIQQSFTISDEDEDDVLDGEDMLSEYLSKA